MGSDIKDLEFYLYLSYLDEWNVQNKNLPCVKNQFCSKVCSCQKQKFNCQMPKQIV